MACSKPAGGPDRLVDAWHPDQERSHQPHQVVVTRHPAVHHLVVASVLVAGRAVRHGPLLQGQTRPGLVHLLPTHPGRGLLGARPYPFAALLQQLAAAVVVVVLV